MFVARTFVPSARHKFLPISPVQTFVAAPFPHKIKDEGGGARPPKIKKVGKSLFLDLAIFPRTTFSSSFFVFFFLDKEFDLLAEDSDEAKKRSDKDA